MRAWLLELRETAHRAGLFFRSPSLQVAATSTSPVRESILLFFLLGIAMVALSIALLPLVFLLSAGQSEGLNQSMSVDAVPLILSVMVFGPVIEELLFRSWLTGRWKHILGAAGFGIALYGGDALIPTQWGGNDLWRGYGIAVVAIAIGIVTSKLVPIHTIALPFEKHFAAIFWLSTLVFGTLHFTNYAGSGGVALIVFTIPQIVAGAFFGYARIKVGLTSAIALHMAYNAIPVAATLAIRAT